MPDLECLARIEGKDERFLTPISCVAPEPIGRDEQSKS
jgi:hypothetical protein